MQTFALSALGVVGLMEIALFAWMVRTIRGQRRLEQRLGHLADAMSLLTETSESGFKANAAEIARMAGVPATERPPAKRASRSRATRPPGRAAGQAVVQEMSEGEAHLRAHLRRRKREKSPAKRNEGRKGRVAA